MTKVGAGGALTKQQLERYGKLKREIAALETQLCGAGAEGYATDVVRGSAKELPYAMHNIVVKGYTAQGIVRLTKRKKAREAECAAVEKLVEDIGDVVLRQIFTWRYIDGKNVAETAALCGYSPRQLHRIVNVYFQKMSLDVT